MRTYRISPRSGIARILWLAVFVLQLTVFIVGISVWFDGLQQVCTAAPLECQSLLQLTPSDVHGLAEMGWSINSYAWYILLTRAALKFIGVIVGLVIFWRRPNDRIAWVASLYLVIGGDTSVADALATLIPVWWFPTRFIQFTGQIGFALLFYLFPNGRFVPRWTRWVTILWVLSNIGIYFFPKTFLDVNRYEILLIPFIVLFFGSFLGAQVYRLLRASTRTEREQTKWVVSAFVGGLIGFLIAISLVLINGGNLNKMTPLYFVVDFGFNALGVLLPIAIGIAILRYRLWDIDVLIRKTLVYSVLTGVLALVYFGGVVLVGELTRSLTGENSSVAVVVSTLSIAALFLPLRRRVQTAIDRRFYRRAYNAAQNVAAFGRSVRDEVDIEKLTGELLNLVAETMQPVSVSLWLRSEQKREANGR